MIEVLLGLLGAALGVALFGLGFWHGFKTASTFRNTGAEKIREEPSGEEAATIEKERERLRSEQNAFHDLLGYNADVAYGRVTMPGKE